MNTNTIDLHLGLGKYVMVSKPSKGHCLPTIRFMIRTRESIDGQDKGEKSVLLVFESLHALQLLRNECERLLESPEVTQDI